MRQNRLLLFAFCTACLLLGNYLATAQPKPNLVTPDGDVLTKAGRFVCGNNLVVAHSASDGVSPVGGDITYGTVLSNLTGAAKCWITQNLGGTKQATAANDATAAAAGWYWQFNRKKGYAFDGTTRKPKTSWITVIDENSNWQAANDPCALLLGASWRLPTNTEWTAADYTGAWANYTNTYNSVFKLHAAGYLNSSSGTLSFRGTSGYYWSSTQGNAAYAFNLTLYSSASYTSNNSKAYGFSVRCLRD